ncbi:hypothetical protein FFLO_07111 [Filobasidium floriforme]|uniref:Mitochondrial inner membrane protease ATP23 n=1 Tax=Filobasidium floriforme TaxID=5210 RepID=A0A8K0NM72_9TREE|nr:peptidase M76 family-domain-containing protein [Filobasidium floriforme]KAG7527259.1 hypothetical protein FFLO_07111 [Filobasidium floriforme]KAH8081207.1 peptidase M76 family-domain-containing protein [Filobasidium floriforme]
MALDPMESSTTPAAGPSTQPETAFEKWRSSLAQLTGLGLNPVEAKHRDERLAQERLEGDWNQCEKWKTGLMKSSPAVVFMMKHLTLSGCPFTAASIQCHPCPPTRSGGFSPDHGILLCQDRFFSKRHMEDTIVHEMIHAFDHCRFEVDWGNLRHHACSEIRSANLSGDCKWTRELRRGFYSFSKQHQACVKRRAVLSVEANPNCADKAMAERAVNEVWDSCFKDTRPFDEIY